MAEVIEEMQERLLPEYEQMQKFNVCTPENLKDIIHKRKRFQTQITKNKKQMRDYLDFIVFERKVHKWVCEKEKLLGKKLSGLKASIAKRIIKLYREGLRHFPHEERLWQNFIQFSKKSVPHEVAGIYERMLTYYGNDEKIWCDYGLWIYQHSNNVSKVKEIFHRALLRHPESEIVNKAFFDILLADAAKMNTERNLDGNTKSEQDFGLQLLEMVYRNSKKHVKDLSYYLSLLERCEMPEYALITISLQKQIIDYIMEMYAHEEALWNFLAMRELRGFSTTDLRNGKLWQSRTERQKIDLCCKVYETAVKTLKTEKMMNFYIDAMLKLNQDTSTELPLKRKQLAIAFKCGCETKLISDDHLATYINMLLLDLEHGLELSKSVLENLANSRTTLKFYDIWLQPYIIEKDADKVYEIFKKAHKEFGLKSEPLSEKVLKFYETLENTELLAKIRALYKTI